MYQYQMKQDEKDILNEFENTTLCLDSPNVYNANSAIDSFITKTTQKVHVIFLDCFLL